MASLIPVGDVVLVEFEPFIDRKGSGALADFEISTPKFEGEPYKGTVISKAKGVTNCQVGDHIIYAETSPEGFFWEGKKLIVVHAKNIMAIGEPE